jgi:surface polysaccharide O-acyltransferase-like enzyme
MATLSRSSAAIWKGVAIWIVVLVHWLAVFPEKLYFDPATAWWSVPFQSFVRLSVPLFLALSGYGLAKKYTKGFVWHTFLSSRLSKLLPLYILWSLTIWLTLELNPEWRIMPLQPIWKQLLLGTADYQLYFVPLILQLYLLFPLFHKLKLQALRWLTVFAFGCQIGLALLIRWSWFHPGFLPLNWLDDQFQYRFLGNWWGYFLLGMIVATTEIRWLKKGWFKISLLIFGLGTLFWASSDTRMLLQSTHNVIFATSFLRVPIIFLAIVSVLTAFVTDIFQVIPQKISRFLSVSGQHSFLIFLAHTTLLRIFFSFCLEKPSVLLNSPAFLFSVLITCGAMLISIFPIRSLTTRQSK